MKAIIFAVLMGMVLLLSTITQSYSSSSGELVIYLKNTNGDRVSAYGSLLKIYSAANSQLITTIEPEPGNQSFAVTLQKNNRYKIESYVNDIYATTDYVTLTNEFQRMDLTTPISGGIKFQIVYNDKNTPLKGATVILKTFTGKQISKQTFSQESF